MKTTIIVTGLDKEAFVASHQSYTPTISPVDMLKLNILNLSPPKGVPNEYGDDYILNNIRHWSNILALSRVIIIFKCPEAALHVYNHLKANPHLLLDNARISLQENLLARSKSYDQMEENLNVQNLEKFKKGYDEPLPHHFDVYNDLTKLGINLDAYNSPEQLDELKASPDVSPVLQPSTPTGISRSRSMTKTLFKPTLTLDTKGVPSPEPVSRSPTITLDETF